MFVTPYAAGRAFGPRARRKAMIGRSVGMQHTKTCFLRSNHRAGDWLPAPSARLRQGHDDLVPQQFEGASISGPSSLGAARRGKGGGDLLPRILEENSKWCPRYRHLLSHLPSSTGTGDITPRRATVDARGHPGRVRVAGTGNSERSCGAQTAGRSPALRSPSAPPVRRWLWVLTDCLTSAPTRCASG